MDGVFYDIFSILRRRFSQSSNGLSKNAWAQTTAVFAITINGKRVGEFVADLNATDGDLAQIARDTVATKLNGAEIIKTIVVPRKLVNFVVKK